MKERLPQLPIEAFSALDIRVGRVLSAHPFPEARTPAIRLAIDFGPPVGVLRSSAQLTRHYAPEALAGTNVLALVNLPPLKVAGFTSECLVLGVVNPDDPGEVVLVRPDRAAGVDTTGWRLG